MIRYLRSRLPLKIIAIWLGLIFLVYLFVIESPRFVSPHNRNELVHLPAMTGESIVQAIVFIAMGDMARDGLVEYAMASVRKVGNWKGPMYLLTDAPACFADTKQDNMVTVVTLPRKSSLMEIKAIKPKLFLHLPSDIDTVLYLDVDIVVTRGLSYFLDMVGSDLALPSGGTVATRPAGATGSTVAAAVQDATASVQASAEGTGGITLRTGGITLRSFDLAAFGDAKGHYVGFCAGCEKWHTGVLLLSRHGAAPVPTGKNKCLQAWADVLASGRYDTDQESLDAAERNGACPHAHMLPSRFLLFAKDYLATLLTTGHTFVHVTSAARLSTQDSFYRWWVPHIRGTLASKLSPKLLDRKKTC